MKIFNKDLKVKFNNQINQLFNFKILISLKIRYQQDNKFKIFLIQIMTKVKLIIIKVNL